MRAALYHEFQGPIRVAEVADPAPPADGVVLRVMANGVCRSDWHAWMGHDPDIKALPHVPGHECAGVIEAVVLLQSGATPGSATPDVDAPTFTSVAGDLAGGWSYRVWLEDPAVTGPIE